MTVPVLGRAGLPVYAPVGAQVYVNNNSRTVDFQGTAFIATDATTGAPIYAVSVGDVFTIPGAGAVHIESINSPTQLTFSETWTGGGFGWTTSQGSPGWYIIRNSVPANGAVAKAIQDLISVGTDANPDIYRTIDNGAARMKLRINSAGKPEVAVGPTGTVDASLFTAVQMDPTTGMVSFPSGYTIMGPGFRNRIVNGDFSVRQRPNDHNGSGGYAFFTDRWSCYNQWGANCTFDLTQTMPTAFKSRTGLYMTSAAASGQGYLDLYQFFPSQ